MSFLVCLFILPDTDVIITIAIFCLLYYSFLSVTNTNVWQCIERRIDVSIDQWPSWLKTRHLCQRRAFKTHKLN